MLRSALLRVSCGTAVLALLAACGGAAPATPDTSATALAAGAAAGGTPQPGGTMTIAYQNDMAMLDPAIGYDWNNWPMEKAVRADYVRTARAKGLTEGAVVRRHVLRNAILPIITLVGLDIPWFLSGVVLIEAVFAWPGMGKLAVDAIRNVDVPLIPGTVLFTALVVVVSNIITDVVYAFVDPRIRYGE